MMTRWFDRHGWAATVLLAVVAFCAMATLYEAGAGNFLRAAVAGAVTVGLWRVIAPTITGGQSTYRRL